MWKKRILKHAYRFISVFLIILNRRFKSCARKKTDWKVGLFLVRMTGDSPVRGNVRKDKRVAPR